MKCCSRIFFVFHYHNIITLAKWFSKWFMYWNSHGLEGLLLKVKNIHLYASFSNEKSLYIFMQLNMYTWPYVYEWYWLLVKMLTFTVHVFIISCTHLTNNTCCRPFQYFKIMKWSCLTPPPPPGQNGRHFADDIFRCIFLKENAWLSFKFLKIYQH